MKPCMMFSKKRLDNGVHMRHPNPTTVAVWNVVPIPPPVSRPTAKLDASYKAPVLPQSLRQMSISLALCEIA